MARRSACAQNGRPAWARMQNGPGTSPFRARCKDLLKFRRSTDGELLRGGRNAVVDRLERALHRGGGEVGPAGEFGEIAFNRSLGVARLDVEGFLDRLGGGELLGHGDMILERLLGVGGGLGAQGL